MHTKHMLVTFASSVLCGPYPGACAKEAGLDLMPNDESLLASLDARVDVFSEADPSAVRAMVSVKLWMQKVAGQEGLCVPRAHLDAVAKAVFPWDLQRHRNLTWELQEAAEVEAEVCNADMNGFVLQ